MLTVFSMDRVAMRLTENISLLECKQYQNQLLLLRRRVTDVSGARGKSPVANGGEQNT